MSYFATALARGEDGWVAAEVDLDRVETLDELVEESREVVLEVGGDDTDVVVLLEFEDEWFGVVRAELDEDALAWVSDAGAALRHALGEILLPDLAEPLAARTVLADRLDTELLGLAGEAGYAEPGAVTVDLDDLPPVDPLAVHDLDVRLPPAGPAGDPELLADLGVAGRRLVALAGARTSAEAVSAVAEALGGLDALEGAR